MSRRQGLQRTRVMHFQYSAQPAPKPPRRRRKKATFLGGVLKLLLLPLVGVAGLATGAALPEPAAQQIRVVVARVQSAVHDRVYPPAEESPFVVAAPVAAATPLIVA